MTKLILILASALTVAACAKTDAAVHSYGNDALPSAEVTAFQAADARLHWGDARIERDARGCAIYQGTAPDGQVRSEPLLDKDNRAICTRR